MTQEMDTHWRKFDESGEEFVRKRLAARIYGEEGELAAKAWLDHKAQKRLEEVERRNSTSVSA